MNFPEGWEWLEGASSWEPPAELRQPTQVWMHNLVISMLSAEILDNESLSLVGQVLAEYAAFNLWVAKEGKELLEATELLACTTTLENVTARTYEAWNAYRTEHVTAGRRIGSARQELEILRQTLRTTARDLEELRRPDSGAHT